MRKHLDRRQIMAYRDGEIPEMERGAIRQHLDGCPRCQAALQEAEARKERVRAVLSVLEPPRAAAERQPALSSVQDKIMHHPSNDQKENHTMWNRIFARRLRPAWIALTVILVMGVALAIPQVRALATGLLGFFRVQQIAVVPVNPTNLEAGLQNAGPSIEQLLSENAAYEVLGETQTAYSAAEASALAGFAVRLPGAEAASEILIKPGVSGSFTIDVRRVNGILGEIGRSDILLPGELDGQQVTAEVPPSVFASFGDCAMDAAPRESDPVHTEASPELFGRDCRVLIQLPSPVLNTPAGLDVAEIGKTFLIMSGMDEAEAEAFSNRIDWSSTLVIPLPVGSANYSEAQVDGVTGTLIRDDPDGGFGEYMLLWVKDGAVYSISGRGDPSAALDLANSLQ